MHLFVNKYSRLGQDIKIYKIYSNKDSRIDFMTIVTYNVRYMSSIHDINQQGFWCNYLLNYNNF